MRRGSAPRSACSCGARKTLHSIGLVMPRKQPVLFPDDARMLPDLLGGFVGHRAAGYDEPVSVARTPVHVDEARARAHALDGQSKLQSFSLCSSHRFYFLLLWIGFCGRPNRRTVSAKKSWDCLDIQPAWWPHMHIRLARCGPLPAPTVARVPRQRGHAA